MYGSGSGSFHNKLTKARKTLTSTIFYFFLDFLSLKTDVNVPSKSNKQENFEKAYFLLASCQPESVYDKNRL